MHNFHMKALYETQISGRSRLKSLKQLRQIPYVNNTNLKEQTKLAQTHLLQILQNKIQQDNRRAENQQMYETFYNSNKNNKIKPNNFNHTSKLSKLSFLNSKKKPLILSSQQSKNHHDIHFHNNKLFQYFEYQYYKQIPTQKVQRQKINFLQRLFIQIKQKIQQKIQYNQQKTKQLEGKLTKKYIQMHQGYEDIKTIKNKIREIKRFESQAEQEKNKERKRSLMQNNNDTNNNNNNTNNTNLLNNTDNHSKFPRNSQLNPTPLSSFKPFSIASPSVPHQKQNLSTISLKPPSYRQRLLILQETIQHQKSQILQLEQQINILKYSYQQIKQEWVGFLRLFLYKGYYLLNGVKEIFKEMKIFEVELKNSDFDQNKWDDIGIRWMKRYYQNFNTIINNDDINDKYKHNINTNINTINNRNNNDTLHNSRDRNAAQSTQFSRCKAYSQIQTNTILKQSNLKSIYSTTKQMMTNLLKDNNFKSIQSQQFLPKINNNKNNINNINNIKQKHHKQKHFTTQSNQQNVQKYNYEEEKKLQINRINYKYCYNQEDINSNDYVKGRLMKRVMFGLVVK